MPQPRPDTEPSIWITAPSEKVQKKLVMEETKFSFKHLPPQLLENTRYVCAGCHGSLENGYRRASLFL